MLGIGDEGNDWENVNEKMFDIIILREEIGNKLDQQLGSLFIKTWRG